MLRFRALFIDRTPIPRRVLVLALLGAILWTAIGMALHGGEVPERAAQAAAQAVLLGYAPPVAVWRGLIKWRSP